MLIELPAGLDVHEVEGRVVEEVGDPRRPKARGLEEEVAVGEAGEDGRADERGRFRRGLASRLVAADEMSEGPDRVSGAEEHGLEQVRPPERPPLHEARQHEPAKQPLLHDRGAAQVARAELPDPLEIRYRGRPRARTRPALPRDGQRHASLSSDEGQLVDLRETEQSRALLGSGAFHRLEPVHQ